MTASTDSSRALVDTNVVIYAYDLDDPSKHTIARVLLERLSDQGRLVFSTQVFNSPPISRFRSDQRRFLCSCEIIEG